MCYKMHKMIYIMIIGLGIELLHLMFMHLFLNPYHC
jgi:hypothetical protein